VAPDTAFPLTNHWNLGLFNPPSDLASALKLRPELSEYPMCGCTETSALADSGETRVRSRTEIRNANDPLINLVDISYIPSYLAVTLEV
jgi:hypothetical protein